MSEEYEKKEFEISHGNSTNRLMWTWIMNAYTKTYSNTLTALEKNLNNNSIRQAFADWNILKNPNSIFLKHFTMGQNKLILWNFHS